MDIHILCYGLGNQFSQYAFYLNRRELRQRAHAFYAFKQHNGYEMDRIFGLSEGLPWYLQFVRIAFRLGISRRFYSGRTADFVLGFFRIKIITEASDYKFDPSLLKPWFGIRIFFGGWHDSRYFSSAEKTVRQLYQFPALDEKNTAILNQIKNCLAVSVHVRRGDYLKGNNAELFGSIATSKYYRNAILRVQQIFSEDAHPPKFFVFSDDIAWCKSSLGLEDATFVNINSGKDSWKDMVLMSQCRVNIIANSTFSWWAGWLNQTPDKKVLCPTKFISTDIAGQTIYPAGWIQIEG